TGNHLWAEQYDRDLKDIFAVQDEITQTVVGALQPELTRSEIERARRKPPDSLDAWDFYQRGLWHLFRLNKEDSAAAIELFKKAVALDAEYSLAWAGLGDAYAQRPIRFDYAFSWLDSAVAVSEKAIALDPNSAETHKALGLAYMYKGWYDKALVAYRKAIERNPNHFAAVGNIGYVYRELGAYDSALPWQKKIVLLNPTDGSAYINLGRTYRQLNLLAMAEQSFYKAVELQPDLAFSYYAFALLSLTQGKEQQALEQVEQLVSIDPNDAGILEWAGQIQGYMGNFSQARQYYQQSIATNPSIETDWYSLSPIGLGHILWKSGQPDDALELLQQSLILRRAELQRGNEASYILRELAAIYAIQGNKTEAYTWLQRAIDAGWRDYRLALLDPWLENLREDEQFQEMMAQVKAMVDEMHKRVEEMGL
ncbi:tetratricopeptide repeat protein, partial [candidate division KSB1 bacterium]|nr:tetratricopeptide repeat protein [candidate division KSB1 bacterium]